MATAPQKPLVKFSQRTLLTFVTISLFPDRILFSLGGGIIGEPDVRTEFFLDEIQTVTAYRKRGWGDVAGFVGGGILTLLLGLALIGALDGRSSGLVVFLALVFIPVVCQTLLNLWFILVKREVVQIRGRKVEEEFYLDGGYKLWGRGNPRKVLNLMINELHRFERTAPPPAEAVEPVLPAESPFPAESPANLTERRNETES